MQLTLVCVGERIPHQLHVIGVETSAIMG